MVPQHPVDLTLKVGAHLLQPPQGSLIGTVGFCPEVTGQHTQVIVQRADGLNEHTGKIIRHVQVQVGNLQQGESFKDSRQPLQRDMVVTNLDAARVAPGPAMQQYQPQAVVNNGTQRIPVFDMEKIAALAKHLALIVTLDPQTLPQMNLANTLLQQFQRQIIMRAGAHMPLSNVSARISIHAGTIHHRFVITRVICYGCSRQPTSGLSGVNTTKGNQS